MQLRHKIALAYAAVLLILVLSLGVYARAVVADHGAAEMRDALASEATLLSSLLLRDGMPIASGAALDKQAIDLGRKAGLRITVITVDGVVIAESQHDTATMVNHNDRPEVVQARRDGRGWAVRHSATLDIDMLYYALADLRTGTIVRVARPMAQVAQLSADLRRGLLLAALLAGLLGVIASLWIAGGVTSSLDHLARTARRLGKGELSARARLTGRDEVAVLADTFDAMADSLQHTSSDLVQATGQVQAILEHMADGLVVVDDAQRVSMLNRAAARLLGTDAGATGKLLEHVVRNYELIEAVTRSVELGTVLEVEFELASDTDRILHASVAPISGSTGAQRGAVVVLRDVTQVRRLERVRQDFVANAGHELRTPVAAIRSLAEALESGASTDPDAGPAFLSQIVDNTARLGRLLDDMMELARLEAGAGEPVEAIEVAPVARKAADRLRPQAESLGVTVDVRVPDDLTALGSVDNLTTALVNLIDNALKYAYEGRRIEVEALPSDPSATVVRLAVIDHGPGIPDADRRRIFERFYRLDRARSRELGGTGLGLSIVKHAVEAMGGAISIEETPSGGATFLLTLPKPD